MATDKSNTKSNKYIPKFYVSQAVYDATPPEERQLLNYAVDTDEPLTLPKTFNMPKDAKPHE